MHFGPNLGPVRINTATFQGLQAKNTITRGSGILRPQDVGANATISLVLPSCRAKSRHPMKLPVCCTAGFLDGACPERSRRARNDTDGMGSGKFQTLDPQRFS